MCMCVCVHAGDLLVSMQMVFQAGLIEFVSPYVRMPILCWYLLRSSDYLYIKACNLISILSPRESKVSQSTLGEAKKRNST